MAYSYEKTTAVGGSALVSVPFPYIDKAHVSLHLDGVLQTGYTWLNDQTIQMPDPIAGGTEQLVRRTTPAGASLVTFTKGGLDEVDLNLAEKQSLYLHQEDADNLADLRVEFDTFEGSFEDEIAAAQAAAEAAANAKTGAETAQGFAEEARAGAVEQAGIATSAAEEAVATLAGSVKLSTLHAVVDPDSAPDGVSSGDTDTVDGVSRGWHFFTNLRTGGEHGVQTAQSDSSEALLYIRNKTDGVWSGWTRVPVNFDLATTPRSIAAKLGDVVSVKDFGAVGDGSAHLLSEFYATLADAQAVYPHVSSLSDTIDWAAAQAAADWMAAAPGRAVVVPPGSYHHNRKVTVTGTRRSNWLGSGPTTCEWVATAAFEALYYADPDSVYNSVEGILFNIQSFDTRGMLLEGVATTVTRCDFQGSGPSITTELTLIISSYNRFDDCRWSPLSANQWAIALDTRSDAGYVLSNHFGPTCRIDNVGRGIHIRRTHPASPRVEGTVLSAGMLVVNTGDFQLLVDAHYGLTITGVCFEESGGVAIDLSNCDVVQITGGTAGVSLGVPPGTACIRLRSPCTMVSISGVKTRGGDFGIWASADAGSRFTSLSLTGNIHDSHGLCDVSLDSADAVVTGNISQGTPSRGSFNTHGSNANKGSYTLAANRWADGTMTFREPAATYNTGDWGHPLLELWEAFTPVVTPGSGTITSYAAACFYRRRGKSVELNISVTIINVGTGAGGFSVTLPFGAVGRGSYQILPGREVAAVGVGVNLSIASGSGSGFAKRYDNTDILATGHTYAFSGSYEMA